ECGYLDILTVHIDGTDLFHTGQIEQFLSGCCRRILAVAREVRCWHLRTRDIYGGNFRSVVQHIVDHRIVVEIGTEDTTTNAQDVPPTLADVPRQLKARLKLECRDTIVRI